MQSGDCQSGIWRKQYKPTQVNTLVNEPNNTPDPGYGVCGADPGKAPGSPSWSIVCGYRACTRRGYTGGLVQEWSGLAWNSPASFTCFYFANPGLGQPLKKPMYKAAKLIPPFEIGRAS